MSNDPNLPEQNDAEHTPEEITPPERAPETGAIATPPQQGEYPQQAQYAHPQYAYAPPPGGPVPPKKKLSTGALIAIIAGGVVLLAIIVALAWAFLKPGGGFAGLGGESPSASVENYLTALSESDAEAARGYIDSYEGDTLLTNEVLQASNSLAPISDITVGEAVEIGPEQFRVNTTFTLGDEPVERTFEVWTINETIIIDGVARFSLTTFDTLGLTVNGADYDGESTNVFPGAYELALSNEGFEIEGAEGALLIRSNDDTQALYELIPVPTEELQQTFRDLVAEALTECLNSKALTTDCGMDVSGFNQDGYSAVDGTVERSLKADGEATLKNLNVRSNFEHPTLLESTDYISIGMKLEAENGSDRAQFELIFGGELGSPSVDFSDESPTVRWD